MSQDQYISLLRQAIEAKVDREMRNRDKYNHEVRLNEVRITFMRNLRGTSFVFLGVYRLSLEQSDTTHCVWERVAETCDLNNLDYLMELRN